MTNATKNSFWYLCFNLSRLVVLFFGNIWISRRLGPEAFGQFSYFLSAIIYISAFDSLCHESIVKQHLAHDDDIGKVLGTASLLNLFIALVCSSIIIGFGLMTIPESLMLATFLLFIPGQLSKPFNPIANLFDIKLLAKYSSLALFIGATISIVVRTTSVTLSENLVYQSFGYSLQFVFYAAALFWFSRGRIALRQWRVSWALLIDIIKKSFPMFLSVIIYLSLSQSDIFMIRHMLDVREVGIYSIVVKLSEPWVIVSSALCTSYFPLIFSHAHSVKKQAKYFVRANQFSIYFVVALGLVLTLMIGKIVSILLGNQYNEVAGIFRIYFWSILFLFFANIQHIWEVYNKKYSISLYKTLGACFLKISLNFVLGRYFGLPGFAVATLIALFFYGFGFNVLSRTTRVYLQLQLRAFRYQEFRISLRFFTQKGRRWLKSGL